MNYKKVTSAQVKSTIKKQGVFKGFIVGNNVNSYHFFSGWHLAHEVEFASLDDMESKVNSFLFYLHKELGDKAAYYKWEERGK